MTKEFGPENFPIIYKRGPNGEVPEEIRELVERHETLKREIEKFEENEPFVQDLKQIAEITKEKGNDHGSVIVLHSENYPFVSMIRYFDRYARIAEKLVDPNLPRVNSRMDLDYLDDMRVGFRVQKSHYKGWENLEAPRESILFPNADKRWADGDWFDCISIEGPADSLGPNTINAIRKFTSITLAALK